MQVEDTIPHHSHDSRPIGELRRLPVREHGGEPGEAVPVAVEDGVLGRRLAAEDGGEHAVVRVPDQRRLQLRAPLPHVHNVHIAAGRGAEMKQQQQQQDEEAEQGGHVWPLRYQLAGG